MAIDFFLGTLLGVAAKKYTPLTDGALEVAEDDSRFIGRLDLQLHPEELAKKDQIVLEIKKIPMEEAQQPPVE
jgi:hypothetical protein